MMPLRTVGTRLIGPAAARSRGRPSQAWIMQGAPDQLLSQYRREQYPTLSGPAAPNYERSRTLVIARPRLPESRADKNRSRSP